MSIPFDANDKFAEYAHGDRLVSTEWMAANLDTPGVVVIESDEDVLLYETGHIPGSVKVDWHTDLQDPLNRDYLNAEAFSALMREKGISRDDTLVFYGDNFNWWAGYALWVFMLFGHGDVRLMDGGRQKWVAEDRPMTTDKSIRTESEYPVVTREDAPIRAFQFEVMAHVKEGGRLIDVRSPEEFSGELLHMPSYPQEGALRGGHIGGASSVPWKRAANDDGSFKTHSELAAIYHEEIGLSADSAVVAYCRIGERSSHTWFVLKYLLGIDEVRNYDGSWTEWGNMVGVPIERP